MWYSLICCENIDAHVNTCTTLRQWKGLHASQHWQIQEQVSQQGACTDHRSACAQKFRLGVPIRDMRLLDPNLLTSETGKLLVRDNAIVFSVEHVRLIITADCVIIPQTGFEQSSLSTRFAVMLEEAIIEASQEKEVGLYIFQS